MSFVNHKTGYHRNIYFRLLFSRLNDGLTEEDKILIKTCTLAKDILLGN